MPSQGTQILAGVGIPEADGSVVTARGKAFLVESSVSAAAIEATLRLVQQHITRTTRDAVESQLSVPCLVSRSGALPSHAIVPRNYLLPMGLAETITKTHFL